MSETPDIDTPPPAEPVEDGAGFRPELVPDSPFADYFRHGSDGAGLSNQEYDETVARLVALADDPDLDEADRDDARNILRGIRGR